MCCLVDDELGQAWDEAWEVVGEMFDRQEDTDGWRTRQRSDDVPVAVTVGSR